MTDDPWAKMENQIVNPRKARIRAAQTRRERAREKEDKEREWQFAYWKKWHTERKEKLLAGPHADKAATLCEFLERLTLDDSEELIELIERQQWACADNDTRFEVLDLVGIRIMAMREMAGMHPFNDPLPGELNAFLVIREILTPS
jgi:hypothetical protein